MAITDLLSARVELKARGYSRFSDTRLTTWLNTALTRFEDYPQDWPWAITVGVGGVPPVGVGTLRRVLSVVDTTHNRTLTPINANALVNFAGSNLTTPGQPFYWYLDESGFVTVYPFQAVSLTIRSMQVASVLANDTDEPLLPRRYRQTWVDLAEVEVLRYGLKDAAAAASLDASVQARLAEIASAYAMQDQPDYSEMLMTGASTDG